MVDPVHRGVVSRPMKSSPNLGIRNLVVLAAAVVLLTGEGITRARRQHYDSLDGSQVGQLGFYVNGAV
jgi:hypothetical protein